MAAEQLLDLVPDDSDCVYLAVADARTAAPDSRIQDRTLLIVNAGDEEHGSTFRALVSEFASIDAAVDDDGVYQGGHESAKSPEYRALKRRLEGRPTLTELLPGDTLRLGALSSRSGTFLLVNQDDGER
jgi:hypothetical protein